MEPNFSPSCLAQLYKHDENQYLSQPIRIFLFQRICNMSLNIDDKKNIQTLQSEFNALFPYLRLMLTKVVPGHDSSAKNSTNQLQIVDDTPLLDYKIANPETPFCIYPEMTVAELEQQFLQRYGLEPIILRKSGNVWIEASITDDWTLEEQNTQGELITKQMNERNKPSTGI